MANQSAPRAPRLLEQVRERLRFKHYSIRTEAQYVQWVRRFILFMASGIQRRWARPRSKRF